MYLVTEENPAAPRRSRERDMRMCGLISGELVGSNNQGGCLQ